MTVSILKCTDTYEVLEKLRSEFNKLEDIFPKSLDADIVIKPNLNSSLDALTGNTTDLRVLGSILRILTEYGYKNITILEGPNGGFHRDGIDVFGRNSIDRLAEHFGCEYKDVNYETEKFIVDFEGAKQVQIAEKFRTADLFINVPKLKTHYETLVSVSLKSLIGVLIGQPNKAKTHASLLENILRLNEVVVPHLHVVDGLIAMEGTGPSAGIPVRTDTVLVGTNAYEIDIVAGALMGFSSDELPLIEQALATRRIKKSFVEEAARSVDPILDRPFEKPKPRLLARLVVMPGIDKVVRVIRNSVPVSRMLKIESVRMVMLFIGLTQEVILQQEKTVSLRWNKDKCVSCGKCKKYCPQLFELPHTLNGYPNNCLQCLYCFAVCPENAIEAEGELGYYKEQIRRFGKLIKERS